MADEAIKARRLVKCQFTRKLRDFLSYVKRDDRDSRVLSWKFEDLQECWQLIQEKHDIYVQYIDQAEITKEDAWIDEVQQDFNSAVIEYASVRRPDHVRTSPVTVTPPSENRMELEALKLPQFNGTVANYPRFKYDFKRYVEPNVAPEIITYTLRTCLAKEPTHLVRNVDDVNKMWNLLDDKYADPSTVVDIILDKIAKTTTLRNDESLKLTQFIDMLEDSYHDLCELGLEKEITTTSSVSIIEKILPPDVRVRWARTVTCDNSQVDKRDKFPSLLRFLLSEKRAMEYNRSPLRSSDTDSASVQAHHVGMYVPDDKSNLRTYADNSYACLLHHNNNHRMEDCVEYLLKSVDGRYDVLRKKGACWSCLQPGHRLRDCVEDSRCGENGCRKRHHASLHTEYTGNRHFGRVHHVIVPEDTSTDYLRSNDNVKQTGSNRVRQHGHNIISDGENDVEQRLLFLEKSMKEQKTQHDKKVESIQMEVRQLKLEKAKLQEQLRRDRSELTNTPRKENVKKRNVEKVLPANDTVPEERKEETSETTLASYRYRGGSGRMTWPFMYQLCLYGMFILAICAIGTEASTSTLTDVCPSFFQSPYFNGPLYLSCEKVSYTSNVPKTCGTLIMESNKYSYSVLDYLPCGTLIMESDKYSYSVLDYLSCELGECFVVNKSTKIITNLCYDVDL